MSSISSSHSISPTKELSQDAVVAPQIVSVPEDVATSEGQTMRFHVRATGNPTPKVEWYLNGQQIRKSKRFSLWNDGLHHLEINPARAYDTGSLVAVAVNKVGQAQASCTVDVEPLGDLRSNLKRVESKSPDAALRAMRMNRKVEAEQKTEVLGEYHKRRSTARSSQFSIMDALTSEATSNSASESSHLHETNEPRTSDLSSISSVPSRKSLSPEKSNSKGLKLKIPGKSASIEKRKGTPLLPNSPTKNAFCGSTTEVSDPRDFAKVLKKSKKSENVTSTGEQTPTDQDGGRE